MSALDTYLRLNWYERNPKRLTVDDKEARISLQKRAIAQHSQLLNILEEAREAMLSKNCDEWLKKHPRLIK